LLKVIGILVFALLASFVGGVTALLALSARSASADECQADSVCSLASAWLRMGGEPPSNGSACLDEDDKQAMAMLASVLVYKRPVDETATNFLGGVTSLCPSVSELALLICQEADGGNANDPSACELIDSATSDSEPAQ
jgi:hypothetical protein